MSEAARPARKRAKNPDQWARQSKQACRNSGQAYINRAGKYVEAKTFDPDPECCKCQPGAKSTTCAFRFIPEEERKRMFNDFWALGDYNLQNAHLYGLLEQQTTKRPRHRKDPLVSRRSYTYKYFVRRLTGATDVVCQSGFCRAFGINKDRIATLKKHRTLAVRGMGATTAPSDRRGLHTNRPYVVSEERKQFVRQHIESFPTQTNHSSGRHTHKRCITSAKSVIDLYRDYVQLCEISGIEPVKESYYRKIFNSEYSITFQAAPIKAPQPKTTPQAKDESTPVLRGPVLTPNPIAQVMHPPVSMPPQVSMPPAPVQTVMTTVPQHHPTTVMAPMLQHHPTSMHTNLPLQPQRLFVSHSNEQLMIPHQPPQVTSAPMFCLPTHVMPQFQQKM